MSPDVLSENLPVNTDCVYFDEHGLMAPGGENGLLFTAEYLILAKEAGYSISRYFAFEMIESQRVEPNRFNTDPRERWSHDNHTGLVCLSKVLGFDYHKKYFWAEWWHRIHPRDIVFYAYMMGGLSSLIAWFFLWIPMGAMIVACLKTSKVRGAEIMLSTDGKILAWLRCKSAGMHLTYAICSYIIKKKPEFGSWSNVFKIYFRDEDHPNVRLSRGLEK